MNEDFEYIDVDDESFLGENEEIICSHCIVISYVECNASEEKEIVDFSQFNFQNNTGIVYWQNYYTGEGVNELTINSNCMVSQKIINGQSEFYWWPAGTITFFKE